MQAFSKDFNGQKVALNKLITEAEKEEGNEQRGKTVREITLGAKGKKGIPETDTKETFDYMQKHDVAKLRKIQEETPEKYAQLTKAYAKGVRYKES